MNKPIRVGIITETHFPRIGGMEIATHNLAQSLNKLPDVSTAISCSTMPEIPQNYHYPYKVYRSKSFSILTPILNWKNIENMIKKEKINILHGLMFHGGGATAIKIGKKFNLPVIVQSHGSDVQVVPEINYGASLNPKIANKINNVIQHADKIIAISNINKEMILARGGTEEKISVIPNGIQHEEIGTIPFEDIRSRYNLTPNDFTLLTVGRNRPIKRMELLFQAIALIKDKNPHIKCICVGPKADLSQMVQTYHLEQNIILTGSIPQQSTINNPPFPELINLYRNSNLYVSVSYREACSLSALDALSTGTPVLVGKKHGIRDAIIEGKTGFTLQQETPEDLAEMLQIISTQKQQLETQRNNIRNSVSHLTWDNIAKQLRDMYLSLI
jgi:glycosyltransferase involved in cell wall biosynthesis